jgi:hypothetical protein
MKLTVTELRQVIREVIAESPEWWENNWAEDEEEEDLEDLDPKIDQDPSGPLRWQATARVRQHMSRQKK